MLSNPVVTALNAYPTNGMNPKALGTIALTNAEFLNLSHPRPIQFLNLYHFVSGANYYPAGCGISLIPTGRCIWFAP